VVQLDAARAEASSKASEAEQAHQTLLQVGEAGIYRSIIGWATSALPS
jgi:hypothetical protein